MRSSLHIKEIVSGHTPESLSPGQSRDLQNFAVSLSEEVESVLGKEAKEQLLNTAANVAPLFLESQITSHKADFTQNPQWHQQAQLTVRQAGTLSGSLAVLCGEEPAGLHTQDCLTSGDLRHSPFQSR